MTLWLLLAAITSGTLALILAPLPRRRGATAPERAIYRDQLDEIAQDLERGILSEDQAKTARLEIERRLLAYDSGNRAVPADDRPIGWIAGALLSIFVAGGAFGLYWTLGTPSLSDHPAGKSAGGMAGGQEAPELRQAAEALAAKLKDNPDDVRGWILLARTQAMLQQWAASAESYRRAMDLTGNAPEVASAYGEMLVLQADGVVGPNALDAFSQALSKDPKNVAARFYLAMAEAQAGRPRKAVEQWRALETDSPADAPWLPALRQNIADAAKAAGMEIPSAPAEIQTGNAPGNAPGNANEMIRSMVARLAGRLEKEPGDVEGWLKLAHSYRVLGEKEKAAGALARAASATPKDARIPLAQARALIEDAGTDKDPSRPIPEAAAGFLRQALTLSPGDKDALWYLGLASAQHRDRKQAATLWQKLLGQLDPGSDQYKGVAAALDALGKSKK